MSSGPPPRPLTPEEVNARWRAGARTLTEIDPEFGRWLKRGQRLTLFTQIVIGIALLLGFGTFLMIVWNSR